MLMKNALAAREDGLEYKFVKFAPTDLTATGAFRGYASKFGNEDLGGDIVAKGAFSKSLQASGPRSVKMLYEHDHLCPIGVWNKLVEDDNGLLSDGHLLLPDENGRGGLGKASEVYTLMMNGVLDGLSIGYRVKAASHDRTKQVRILEEIELKEISLVLYPMNEEAVISSVKSKSDLPTEREFQYWLQRDAGFSRSEAEAIIASGFKSLLKAKRDAGGEVASTPPDAGWSPLLVDGIRRLTEAIR
jgi:HK97 family phage prohead protease